MPLYILTYDHAHRRTEELVFRLLMQGIKPELLLLPWEGRKERFPLVDLAKRPSLSHPKAYCIHLGIKYRRITGSLGDDIPDGSKLLVGGAGLLSRDFVEIHEIINAHPGKIPKTRGLDSLKWAIYYDDPIYCTLHRIDAETDLGHIIMYSGITLYPNDTIHSIADRMWYMQLEMLAWAGAADSYSSHPPVDPAFEPHKRMPPIHEVQMMERLTQRLRGINE